MIFTIITIFVCILLLIISIYGFIASTSAKVENNKNSTTNNSVAEKNTENKKTTRGVIIFIAIIAILFFVYKGSSNDSDTYSATCTACNETYSYEGHEYGGWAQRNVKCIRMTNLCKECYEIYCRSIGKTPTDY